MTPLLQPGPFGLWQKIQNGLYYLHIGLATLIIGLFGLPFAMMKGQAGANAVARCWIGYLLWAARLHLGLSCEVRGTPPNDDCIVAAKHQSFFDILAIAQTMPRPAFIMKRELLRVPVMGWYARQAGCIPIDRTKGRDALKMISATLNARIKGEGLGQLIIYPEGTRTLPGEHRPYKHGVATIRSNTGLPVVPVAVNAGMFWPRSGWGIRPGRAVVEFLPRIEADFPDPNLMGELSRRIETNSDRLMADAGLRALVWD